MEDQVFIQYRFTITQDGDTFSDALLLTPTEYQSLTPDQIETMKQDRFSKWRQFVQQSSQQDPTPPLEQLAAINDQIDQLTSQKLQIQEQIGDN